MNWSEKTEQICTLLIEQMHMPANFFDIVRHIYMPLVQIISEAHHDQPLLVSINGAQGTGKSTLTRFLKSIIESELDCNVAELSLDDFYLTRDQRQSLARQVHPLFVTRGVPGTHDTVLIEQALDALVHHQPCRVPRFNKAIDDRYSESKWADYKKPVEIILFEGWCNHSPPQNDEELVQPVNQLEETEDPHGVWRNYANTQLKDYHARIFDRADMCIMLKPADFEHIFEWRKLQEQKLRDSTSSMSGQHIMNDAELERFIQHYERITRHTLANLPAKADIVLPVNPDHSIEGVINNHV